MSLTRTLFTVLLFVCVTHTLPQKNDPELQEELVKIKDECSKETGIAVAVVDKAWNDNNFPDDDKLKCYLKCQLLKIGTFTESGDVVHEKIKSVSAQFGDELIAKCGDVQDTDLCEKAMKFVACSRSIISNEVID